MKKGFFLQASFVSPLRPVTKKGHARLFKQKKTDEDELPPLVRANNGSQGNRFVRDADL